MRLRTVTTAAAASLFAASSVSAEIRREDFQVTTDYGVQLAVREVSDTKAGGGKPPVILVHGARVPGIASFDLPVQGGSLAADLARAGHRVFVMDVRGYGGSSRAGQDGSADGDPLANSHEVMRDIGAVADAVERRAGNRQVALLGWATGGHWSGMYAALNPERVSHLVFYNSLYGGTRGHPLLGPDGENADPADRTRFNVAKFGAYRLNTAASLLPSWDRSIPIEHKADWRDPAVAEAYQEAALASDPTSAQRNPASFRAPSGAMEDSFYLASGRQLWDAAAITARVLIVRSANDFWSRQQDVTMLQRHLINAEDLRAITIRDATHYVHLDRSERGRAQFLAAVIEHLSQTTGGEVQQ
ncbi:alpha/beta hydrolase [Mesorhizobium sp. M1050]|uniref:alpha/beta hydrolase n=1 Tax=unclassified Mesorhizobium TaxID=325217 RepID=UPI0033396F32